MYTTFIKVLTWNSSTTFLYKSILLCHQIMLYTVISKFSYGIQSTLFATIYALIACTNFGFEETLLPFFSTYSQSQTQFKQILHHFILRICAVAIISFIFYATFITAPFNFIQNIRLYCDDNIIVLITLIFFVESIKKSIGTIIQLAFLQKKISYAELGMLTSYVTTIWLVYHYQRSISLFTIFMPMFITSLLELIYLSYVFFKYYKNLPIKISNISYALKIPFKVVFTQRIYNWIHQITKTIFSPNILTIMFAYMLGFQQAAMIKFFTNIITLGYTWIHKAIGISSAATLSAINHAPIREIQPIFNQITRAYFKFLYSMSTVIGLVISYSYYMHIITPIMALQIIIFFCIGFLEQITLTYEQLFISQKKSQYLALINITELTLLFLILYINKDIHGYICMIIFVIAKLVSLTVIELLAQKYWNIRPILLSNHYIKICIAILFIAGVSLMM